MNIKRIVRYLVSACKIKNIVPVYEPIDSKKMLLKKTAVIVGGSGGIGKAIAKKLYDSGANVIITATSEESLASALKEVNNNSRNIKGIVFRLEEINDYCEKIAALHNQYGKIDIFVNCSGVHTEKADFWTITKQEYMRVINTNLNYVFFLCQEIAKYMRNNKIRGHICIVSSSRGLEPAWTPYGISKWGINGLIKGLSKELISYGIIVNGIAPGSTATKLIGVEKGDTIYSNENDVGRLVMPEEVAEFTKLLVSDIGNMVVGDILTISGGRGTYDIR